MSFLFRRKRKRGVLQPLSPMSLYPRPPPNGNKKKNSVLSWSNGREATTASDGNNSNNSSSSNNNGDFKGGNNNNNSNGSGSDSNNGLGDFDNFEYPDSPTQKWLADNADLSPLTVLDNINLKTEFPYSANGVAAAAAAAEVEKPPDINSITLDAENLVGLSCPPVEQIDDLTNQRRCSKFRFKKSLVSKTSRLIKSIWQEQEHFRHLCSKLVCLIKLQFLLTKSNVPMNY